MAAAKQLFDDVSDEQYGLIPLRGLSYEEGFAVLDLQARRRLNMSGAEFLEKWLSEAFSEEFKDEHHSAMAVICLLAAPIGR